MLRVGLLLLLIGNGTESAQAQEANRAGLVVIDGAGAPRTFCVEFAEAEVSGYDLLQRTGLDLQVEASAMGATICAIDGAGCAYPAVSCFCQCQGSPCVYWSYWALDDDGWRYETLGAANTRVRHGDVQGWRWGAGTITEAEQPPLLTWDDLCAPDSAAGTAVGSAAEVTTAPRTASAAAATSSMTPTQGGAAQANWTAAVTERTAEEASAHGNGLEASTLFTWLAVLAAPLALGGWLLWRRRGEP